MFLREGRAAACYLKPPDHTIGGPNAERRQDDRGGKNGSSSAHGSCPCHGGGQHGSFFGSGNREPRRRQRRPRVPLVIWAEAQLFCGFCSEMLRATDVMGWDKGTGDGTGGRVGIARRGTLYLLGPGGESAMRRSLDRENRIAALSKLITTFSDSAPSRAWIARDFP